MEVISAFLSLSLVVLLATPPTIANDVSRCPTNLPRDRYLKASDWNKCYRFHMEERSWKVAAFVCRREGGLLVTVNQERIQKFLVKSLRDLRWPRRGLWLGANDKRSEMDWEWITGEMVNDGYSNWAPGQPSCGILCLEDCALMRWKERDGRWHDYHCSVMEHYSFICQFDMLPAPTTKKPTTTTTTPTTTTTTTSTTTTTTTTTMTTPPSTTTTNTTARVFKMLKKHRSNNLLNGRARTNGSIPSVYPYGSKDARHGQVRQVESQSAGLTSGSLVGLVVGILIGLSCAVCFIFFILLRRRKRKQSLEEDPRTSFDNPYYAEAPNVVYRPNGNRGEDSHDDNDNDDHLAGDIGCASGGYEDDYLKPQMKGFMDSSSHETSKMKLPPPPSPLHSKPKLVMNDYDTPPTLTAPKRIITGAAGVSSNKSGNSLKNVKRGSKNINGGRNQQSKSAKCAPSDEEENLYTEVHPRLSNGYTYDVPKCRNEMDYTNGAACGANVMNEDGDDHDISFDENNYYNDEENMYESLDNLTDGAYGGGDGEETKRLMASLNMPGFEREETGYEEEAIYENNTKENNYVPLKCSDNIYY